MIEAESLRRWAGLAAGMRYRILLREVEEAFPDATRDPGRCPDEAVADLVRHALPLVGRFDDAIRFLGGDDPLARSQRRALEQRKRLLAPIATLLAEAGRVTTVLGERRIEREGVGMAFVAEGTRVDVELCLQAVLRMRPKLARWFGVSLEQFEVEVYASPEAFLARAERMEARVLPAHVEGLTATADRLLLVQLGPGLQADPYGVLVRLRHELTHLAVRELAEGQALPPFWLDEGLAITLSQGLDGGLTKCWERAGERGLPFSLLERGMPGSAWMRGVALAQSAIAVQRLVRELGAKEIAARIRRGDSWSSDDVYAQIRDLGPGPE